MQDRPAYTATDYSLSIQVSAAENDLCDLRQIFKDDHFAKERALGMGDAIYEIALKGDCKWVNILIKDFHAKYKFAAAGYYKGGHEKLLKQLLAAAENDYKPVKMAEIKSASGKAYSFAVSHCA